MVFKALILCLLLGSAASQIGFDYQPAYVQNLLPNYMNDFNIINRQYKKYFKSIKNCQCSCRNCNNPTSCCIESCLQCQATDTNFLYVPYPVPIIIEKKSNTSETTKTRTTTKITTKLETTATTESPKTTTKKETTTPAKSRKTTTIKSTTKKRTTTTTESPKTTTKKSTTEAETTTTTESPKTTTTEKPEPPESSEEADDEIFGKSTHGLFLVKSYEDSGERYLHDKYGDLPKGRMRQQIVYRDDGIKIRPTIPWRNRNMKSITSKRSRILDILPIPRDMEEKMINVLMNA